MVHGSFGDYLHQLRTRLRLTQEELADRTGLSVRTLRYLESGRIRKPRWATVQRLVTGLDLTPGERQGLEEALDEAAPGAAPQPGPQAPPQPQPQAPEAPAVAVVSGAPGIGKSTPTVHWGHRSAGINIALLRELQERFSDANDHALRALDLYRAAGHRAGEGIALNSLGYGYALTGNLRAALQYCTEALAVTAEVGHEKSRAHTYDSLGYISAQRGEFGTAAGYYSEALNLFRAFGDRFLEADAHIKLGDVARDAGDGPGARTAWSKAAAIIDDLNHPRADEVHELLRTAVIPAR